MNLFKISLILVAIVSQVSCDADDSPSGGRYYPPSCLSILHKNNFLGEKIDIPEYNFTFQLNDEQVVGTVSNAVISGMANSLFDNMIILRDISNYNILIFKKTKNVSIQGSAKVWITRYTAYGKSFQNKIDLVFSIFLENIIIKYEYEYSHLQNNISFLNSSFMSISHLAIRSGNDESEWYIDLEFWDKDALQKGRLFHITHGIEQSITSIINNNLKVMSQEDILRLKKECLENL